MFKVIKHGNTIRIYKCDKCGCIFIASKREMEDLGSCRFIYCPECANLVRKNDFTNGNQETINVPSCWNIEDHNKKYEAIHTSATTDDCIKRQ